MRVSALFYSICKSGHTSFSSMCILCKNIKPQAKKKEVQQRSDNEIATTKADLIDKY